MSSYGAMAVPEQTRSTRGWLIGLRSVQMVVAIVSTALSIVALALFGNAYASYNLDQDIDPVLTGVLVAVVVAMAIQLLTLALSITFLVYTVSPKARSRASCCGNGRPCAMYSTDLAWDIVMCILWGLSLIRSIVRFTGILDCVFAAVMTVLFIATAALSSKMRRKLQESAGPIISSSGAAAAAPAGDVATSKLHLPPTVV